MCTCTTCEEARATIDKIFCVLNIYGWLLDVYVVDFFQEKLWNKLPKSWRNVLENVSPEEFGTWLTSELSCKRVWPLSLLALRQVAISLQINRDYKDPKCIQCHITNTSKQSKHLLPTSKEDSCERPNNSINTKLEYLFKKHVKKKKRHEIEQIAQVCANCAQEAQCTHIVDIGAGMGHLARVLAMQYNLNVGCVDQNALLSLQAKKYDEEFLMSIRKHLPCFSGGELKHVSSKLQASNHVDTDLLHCFETLFTSDSTQNSEYPAFGLIGLHCCGDLSCILLKLYSEMSRVRFICIVGCCYMKLTLGCESDAGKGYPLSNYLFQKNYKLSYNALEVACHAIEKHCDKLKIGNYEDLIVHAYRATLETILIKKSPSLRRTQLRNTKVCNGMSFEQYCNAATADLQPNWQPLISDLRNSEIEDLLKHWQKVVIFGSLRLLLAPLIETVVVLDRFLFLSDQNLRPLLKPIFSARLSPRNFVLISIKNA